MTEEQILEFAEICGVKKRCDENLYKCREDQLLKFAREMYRKGKYAGYESGYDDGCYEATGGQ